MPQEDADAAMDAPALARPRRRAARKALLVVLALLLVALLLAWFERYSIADNIIARELGRRGVEARYRIEEISPTRQVLSAVSVGDPAAPDLTVEQVVLTIRPRFGFPQITSVRLVRPRLRASLRDGALSFGALDPLVFTDSQAPFQLPDWTLAVDDGRAWLDSDFGRIGIGLAGRGNLRSGFAGAIAASAPRLAAQGCTVAGASLRGHIKVASEIPRLTGPLTIQRLDCGEAGVALAGGSAALDIAADRAMKGVDGQLKLALGKLAISGARLASATADAAFTWRDRRLTTRYALDGRAFTAAGASANTIVSEGLLRTRQGFARIDLDGEFSARGLSPGRALDRALAGAQVAGEGTLAAPLLARIRHQLASETRASSFAADFTVKLDANQRIALVPRAVLRGTSGAALLSLTRGEARSGQDGAPPQLAGEFTTGGEGLPRIQGRIERSGGGVTELRLSMPEYAAQDARLSLPAMAVRQAADGSLAIAGQVRASGPLPGGTVQELELPVTGRWTSAAGLALWPACTEMRFARLQLANLALDRDALTLCPPNGSAIVRSDKRGLRIAAGTPSLDLAGRIGQTPIRLATGPVGLAYPGVLTASRVAVALGPQDTASHFTIANLTAAIGSDIAGRFEQADIRLSAVPLDLLGAAGAWRYAAGRLLLADGSFTLEDRSEPDRFLPLTATGATLALENNVITADATLAEPRSGSKVTQVALRHDLTTGAGHADLAVPGITFADNLQPTDLTPLALGVVALVKGTVTGSGRIDWSQAGIASSTGRFSSNNLDFAAAFGPVTGASGTVEFSDLLGLTTAPGQRLKLATVNPGIEIYDGEVAFQLREGTFVDLQSARWPFLGGTLAIRPLTIAIGADEQRGYILDIEGLDAAKFVQRMQLDNFAVRGILDGTIPVIFDAQGNGRLEGGTLAARAPGGNVAYVGQLTYEDMGAMANFAFDMLRSLDFREMRIGMDGPLTGELVTRVELEGVSQGADIEKNFITRRLAAIPVRLLVNLRAPFYQLIGSLRSLYDPTAVRDPRELGLIGDAGEVLRQQTDQTQVEALDTARQAQDGVPQDAAPGNPPTAIIPDIQPPESEPSP